MAKPPCGVAFPKPEILSRDWGYEECFTVSGEYTGKIIMMEKGTSGGLQYHRIKNEAGRMLAGELLITYIDEDGKHERLVVAGDWFHFPPGAVHKAKALTEVIYAEFSNPVFNDRVHVEAKYGEEEEGGLPTTMPWEIEHR